MSSTLAQDPEDPENEVSKGAAEDATEGAFIEEVMRQTSHRTTRVLQIYYRQHRGNSER
jgi:hypothetical protein